MPNFLVAGTGAFNVSLVGKPKRLRAWHMSTMTSAQVVNLRDGSATGPIVARINLGAGTSASEAYPSPEGLLFPQGLFVEVTGAGVLTGSVTL